MLDTKLDNSTLLVVLVAVLIFLVWAYVPQNKELASKNNLLEISNIVENWNILTIDGKKYTIIFKELK